MTREEYLAEIEKLNTERRKLRAKELKLVDEYINANKGNALWGEEIIVRNGDETRELHGFLGGWTVSTQGYVVPLVHKVTKQGTMNRRSMFDTNDLTEYTITIV